MRAELSGILDYRPVAVVYVVPPVAATRWLVAGARLLGNKRPARSVLFQ